MLMGNYKLDNINSGNAAYAKYFIGILIQRQNIILQVLRSRDVINITIRNINDRIFRSE